MELTSEQRLALRTRIPSAVLTDADLDLAANLLARGNQPYSAPDGPEVWTRDLSAGDLIMLEQLTQCGLVEKTGQTVETTVRSFSIEENAGYRISEAGARFCEKKLGLPNGIDGV